MAKVGDFPFPSELIYDRASHEYDNRTWNHLWKLIEQPVIKQWLNELVLDKESTVLDAGGGTSPYFDLLKKYFKKVISIDSSEEMLEMAFRTRGVFTTEVGDIRNIKHDDAFFDHIISTRVISHIERPEKALRELYRVLKSGGSVFISDIHPKHKYTSTSFEYEGRKIYAETYKHDINIIKEEANDCGFDILQFSEQLKSSLEEEDLKRFEKVLSDKGGYLLYILILKKP